MRLVAFLSVALALLVSNRARADISYSYVAGPVVFNSSTGQDNVNIYLQETLTGNSQSILAQTSGLYGYGVYIAGNASGTGKETIAGFTSASPFTGNQGSSASLNPSGLPANSIDYNATIQNSATVMVQPELENRGVRVSD